MIYVGRFRRKADVVEALKFSGTTMETMRVYQWVESHVGSFDPALLDAEEKPTKGVTIDPATGLMIIATRSGLVPVHLGDWVIRGALGEFKAETSDVFVLNHEPA